MSYITLSRYSLCQSFVTTNLMNRKIVNTKYVTTVNDRAGGPVRLYHWHKILIITLPLYKKEGKISEIWALPTCASDFFFKRLCSSTPELKLLNWVPTHTPILSRGQLSIVVLHTALTASNSLKLFSQRHLHWETSSRIEKEIKLKHLRLLQPGWLRTYTSIASKTY